MRILQLYQKLPLPSLDGGSQVVFNLTSALLSKNHNVQILCLTQEILDLNKVTNIRNQGLERVIHQVHHNSKVNWKRAFLNLFTNKSYFISRFYSNDYKKALETILKEGKFDIVQIEHLFMCQYLKIIKDNTNANVVYRPQNIESEIWNRYLNGIANPMIKIFLKIALMRLEKFEKTRFDKFDAIIPLTPEDTSFVQMYSHNPIVRTIPFGIKLPPSKEYFDDKHINFYHLASMNWRPNLEAINWFFTSIYPKIKLKEYMGIHVAGGSMPNKYLSDDLNKVSVYDQIDDVNAFLKNKQVLFVPLKSGSGVRVKIIEAMANQKTVIATSIAAQGINYTDKINILIAESAEDFSRQFDYCLTHPERLSQISKEARMLMENEHDIYKIADRFLEVYRQILSN